MREATDRLEAEKATDAWTSQLLGQVLARRVASLQDDPHTTLFFGRVDMRTEHGEETFHVGRRHVSDDRGDPVVVDWRAPISTAFYRASPAAPMGVELRRRFGVDRGRLTAYEDERLTRGDVTDHSAILAAEIERPRSGPMRDIVSTIQPEQDEIVRSDLAHEHLRAGRPRHRQDRRRPAPRRRGCSTPSAPSSTARACSSSGPTGPSSTTSAPVLPSLGEARVGHATIDALLDHGRVRARGHHRRRDAQGRRAARRGAAPGRVVARRPPRRRAGRAARVTPLAGARRTRSRTELDALVTRGVRYSAARDLLPQRLAHRVLLQIERTGDSPDDRVQHTVSRSAPVTAYVRTLWPTLDPADVLFRPPLGCRGARRRRRRHPHRRRAADPAVAEASSHQGRGPLVAGRPGPARRGGRPARPHAEPRARRARRGAGPLTDAAAGRRPPCVDRVAHGARRHRPGHHAVGHAVVARRRWATSAARPTSSWCSTAVSACRGWSSTSPRGSCRTWLRGWVRRRRCVTTRGRLTVLPTGEAGTGGRGGGGRAHRGDGAGLGGRHRGGCRGPA